MKKIWLGLMLTVLVFAGLLGGCGKDSPTGVGGALVEGDVRTFEVVMNAADFLVMDTTYDNFVPPSGTPFLLVANQFEGSFDAHALLKYTMPTQFTYTDTTDNSFTDTLPHFTGGTVTLYVDTTADQPSSATRVSLYRLTEPFDTAVASWTVRLDTGGVQVPWTQPGGTRGLLLDTVSFDSGVDSLMLHVDSATAALMADTAHPFPGLLVTAAGGARLRFSSNKMTVDARPTAKPDTIIPLATGTQSMFIHDGVPPPPGDSLMRVGGIPGWRFVLRFQPLDTMHLDLGADCGLTSCVLPMEDMLINYASLQFTPHFAGAFRPEKPFLVDVLAVLEDPGVPLVRAPLSPKAGGVTGGTGVTLATDPYTANPQTSGPVEIPVTQYLRTLTSSSTAPEDRHTALAVVPINPSSAFGYAEFMSATTGQGPKLRLIISVVNPGNFK